MDKKEKNGEFGSSPTIVASLRKKVWELEMRDTNFELETNLIHAARWENAERLERLKRKLNDHQKSLRNR